jgi:hypothetical protein
MDRYTKWMLGVIATTLTIIAANDLVHTAFAQIGFARVQICDERNCTQLFPITLPVQGRQAVVWGVPVVRAN